MIMMMMISAAFRLCTPECRPPNSGKPAAFKNAAGLLALLLMMMTATPALQAQDQTIVYIDSEYILDQIPEYDGVQQRLDQLTRAWEEDIAELESEIENLEEDFETREILLTPEVREERRQEIQNKKQELERYIDSRFGPDGDYFRQQRELLQPIQRQIVEATSEVAERAGYDYVIDRSGDYVFFYARARWDISIDVLLEMGIQVDEQDSRNNR